MGTEECYYHLSLKCVVIDLQYLRKDSGSLCVCISINQVKRLNSINPKRKYESLFVLPGSPDLTRSGFMGIMFFLITEMCERNDLNRN